MTDRQTETDREPERWTERQKLRQREIFFAKKSKQQREQDIQVNLGLRIFTDTRPKKGIILSLAPFLPQSCKMSTIHLTINELLCFVSGQADKLPNDFLHQKILEFYSEDEVTLAKTTLLCEFDKVLNPDAVKEQRKNRLNGKTSAKEKIVKDILEIWQILD